MDDETWAKAMKVVSPGIRKMVVSNVAFVWSILFYTYLTLHLCSSKLSAYELWLPKVVGLSHIWWIKVSSQCHWKPQKFVGERIRVGKEDSGTSNFNQSYDKFQVKQGKDQTRELLELTWREFQVKIIHWHIIVIISTAIKNIPTKFWTCSFVAVNLHSHHRMIFRECINRILPAIQTVQTAYFWNHEGL